MKDPAITKTTASSSVHEGQPKTLVISAAAPRMAIVMIDRFQVHSGAGALLFIVASVIGGTIDSTRSA